MRFALKVVPLALLGCAAALLVACGDRNGLVSGSEASSLQEALAAAQIACASGDEAGAELAAQRFAERVDALPQTVDRRLVANLQQGAATLATLATAGCTDTSSTPTTPTTITTTTTPTTTTEPTTPTTPTTPIEPTTPTIPPTTPTPPTVPPDDGSGNGGGTPGGGNPPPGPAGNPGGAAPGQGGDG